jgi:hypothetical protein
MIVLRREVAKRCPFRDEFDIGMLTVELQEDDAPELYELASIVDSAGEEPISHEAYTRAIADLFKGLSVTVTTTWRTGPWLVECST